MADPFEPKFADLVRNYSTTVGTGNFVLGDATPGYRSFAAQLQPGDRFYYSALGIDKPQEFEVGRGTLQADGTISREPIEGSPTIFTTGSKSIALVAAAEWYEGVDACSSSAASRLDLASAVDPSKPVLLHEIGREGLFVFNAADLSVEVAADSLQGIYVAPTSDPSGASGAWTRRYDRGVEVRWFGAAGDGVSDDSAAIQAAIRYVEQRGGGIVRLGNGTFSVTGELLNFEADLTIDARGATVVCATTQSIPTLWIGGARVKILGGTWKVTAGDEDARHFDIDGNDCHIDGAELIKEPETGGYQVYLRHVTTGFKMTNCRTAGSNGLFIEGSRVLIAFNRFVGRPIGGDDAIAIKAARGATEDIRIIGNTFENLYCFCSIGSEIGMIGANDPTYSRAVRQVAVIGNTGLACTGMLYIKPGRISNADYRDGLVEGVVLSDNTLTDLNGLKFERTVALEPARGGRIRNVKGANNVVVARGGSSSGRMVGTVDCWIADYAAGSAQSSIEDIDLEISFADPYAGVAAGGAAPGYPVNYIAAMSKQNPANGTISNMRLAVSGDGCHLSGVAVDIGFDDAISFSKLRLKNVNTNGSASNAGVLTGSRLMLTDTEASISLVSGQPYKFISGTSGDVHCPALEREAFLAASVAAGVTDTQYPLSAPKRCQLAELRMSVTASIVSSDTVWTAYSLRNQGGTGNIFHNWYTKATPSTDGSNPSVTLTAGVPTSVMHLRNVTSASLLTQTLFPKGALLSVQKNASLEGGGGRAVANGRVKARWLPY